MNDLFNFALTTLTAFIAIMNPVANVPVFLGVTGDRPSAEKKQIAQSAVVTAFFIGLVFIVLGKYIFELFGITIPAFKIAGGILLFYVGFEMLQSKKSNIHNTDQKPDGKEIAISPLAIPILAGPGTIVTAMNAGGDATYLEIGVLVVIYALVIAMNYIAFVYSDKVIRMLGNRIIMVVGKLMGLILAIIGVGMVISGIKIGFNL